MKIIHHFTWQQSVLILFCGSLLVLFGCASDPTKFYVLTPSLPAEIASETDQSTPLAIGIGPIVLPDYVNRPQIVTMSGQNEVIIDEFHRWGESLNNNVSRVLSDNLAMLLSTENINTYPWNRMIPIDYQVKIHVTRFDSELGNEATLVARWIIATDQGRNEIKRKKSVIHTPLTDESYDAIAVAQSRAFGQLSQEIASEINRQATLSTVAANR